VLQVMFLSLKLSVVVVWVLMLCGLLVRYQVLGGTVKCALNVEVMRCSETSVITYKTVTDGFLLRNLLILFSQFTLLRFTVMLSSYLLPSLQSDRLRRDFPTKILRTFVVDFIILTIIFPW
jgi:hypothetical protein